MILFETKKKIILDYFQNELANVLVFIEQDNPKNFIIAEPELEIFEFELLNDPNIQSQLDFGHNVEYKIPETRIQTMPIEQIIDYNNQKQVTGGDWLDCASRNSGIPKWILLTAILAAVLIALWLSLSTDKKGDADDDVNLLKDDLNADVESAKSEEKNLAEIDEVEFLESSQYLIEDQKI